jgi:hypothetical protein
MLQKPRKGLSEPSSFAAAHEISLRTAENRLIGCKISFLYESHNASPKNKYQENRRRLPSRNMAIGLAD